MDRNMKAEVRDIVIKVLEEFFDWPAGRVCPKCGMETRFIKFPVQDPKDEESFLMVPDKLRCLNCLAVCEEVLQEVKEGE